MRKQNSNFILLEKVEREQLQQIADSESFSDARRRRAGALLLLDIGPDGSGLSRKMISEQTGFPEPRLSLLLKKAMESGPVQTAMGDSREGRGKGMPNFLNRRLSPEQEIEVKLLNGIGKHTKAELARRYDVHYSTVNRIIERNGQDL